jgi:hypothetical protein
VWKSDHDRTGMSVGTIILFLLGDWGTQRRTLESDCQGISRNFFVMGKRNPAPGLGSSYSVIRRVFTSARLGNRLKNRARIFKQSKALASGPRSDKTGARFGAASRPLTGEIEAVSPDCQSEGLVGTSPEAGSLLYRLRYRPRTLGRVCVAVVVRRDSQRSHRQILCGQPCRSRDQLRSS